MIEVRELQMLPYRRVMVGDEERSHEFVHALQVEQERFSLRRQ
jgi:hypothetical protein